MNQKWVAVAAVVVIVIAALLLLRQTVWNPETRPRQGPTVEQMISQIENNPRMPPQAKAAAIAQIRARMGSGAGLVQPSGQTSEQK